MWTERHRGKPGFLGWIVFRWDVFILRGYVWRLKLDGWLNRKLFSR